MAQSASIENSFTAGLKTEFTALNFPEHAATDTDNCVYEITGDVLRRQGIDYETNYVQTTINRSGKAMSTYKWNNVGGDGTTQILVNQVGSMLYFYKYSTATVSAPISTKILVSTVDLTTFLVVGSTNDPSIVECQYSDGNGYLFVYHPYLESFYCSFSADVITATSILLQIRDFTDVPDALGITTRPGTLSAAHNYNLTNHGWVSTPNWAATDTTSTVNMGLGPRTFSIASGLSITAGQTVNVYWSFWAYPSAPVISGVVNSYSGTTLTVNINFVEPLVAGFNFTAGTIVFGKTAQFTISPFNTGYIGDWFTSQGNYPSNADVWWYFKNSSDTFDPTTTVAKVTQNNGYATRGHNILQAFNLNRNAIVSGITNITTTVRPRTGTWFQGRVWYTGVDASQAATGTAPYTTWTESIYFSQIVTDSTQFGMCYQVNDPTSETLFSLLPTDGGVIQIQGCGAIYKLFPIQNGMLVFAANGIWFITGSQGIGFSANDYTITKISSVESISSTSFVNVQGLPMFWNEEGIYTVQPTQQGLGLTVDPITVGTIGSFYEAIPKSSKRYVRGDYHPINYVVQWAYRDTEESSVTDRYEFNRILNYNVYSKAFYPYSITGTPHIHDVNYIPGIGGATSPDPVFKYLTSVADSGTYKFTFSEENDDTYVDWYTYDTAGTSYTSYFVTGYNLKGQAYRKFQPTYVLVFSRNDFPNSYKIQGVWDFANSANSNRWSTVQTILNGNSYFGMVTRRHKIRGHGLSMQIKVISVEGMPFDIMGWSVPEQINDGV